MRVKQQHVRDQQQVMTAGLANQAMHDEALIGQHSSHHLTYRNEFWP
jgi:hypothetical protein